MSRFWAQGESSDESDNDEVVEEELVTRGGKFGVAFSESDSDSDDEKRVVKSQKDRAWENIIEGIGKIRNSKKTNDWGKILDEFEAVNKMIDKSKMLIAKNGIPKFYIKMLAEVEDFLNMTLENREAIKSMKPVAKRALDRMKLTVKKHNKGYDAEIADFRANPTKYESEEEEDSDDDSDDDDSDDSDEDSDEDSDASKNSDKDSDEGDSEEDDLMAKPKTKKVIGGNDSDEDSVFGADDDEESDEDSDEEGDSSRPVLKGRAKWLKKAVPEKKAKAPLAPAAAKEAKVGDGKEVLSKREKKITKTEKTAEEKDKKWHVDNDMTEDVLDRKITELVSSRGRKANNVFETLRKLEVLSKVARLFGPRKEIPVLMHLVSAMYDSHRVIDDFMELQEWRTCYRCLMRIVTVLNANKELVLDLMPTEDVTDLVLATQIKSDFNKNKTSFEASAASTDDSLKSNYIKVVGSLEQLLLRLEDEYTKSLQQTNPHTQEYVVRLSDEAMLVELAESMVTYYRRVSHDEACAALSLMIVEHVYYKHDTVAVAVQRSHAFNKVWGRHSDLHPGCKGKVGLERPKVDPKFIHPASYSGSPSVTVAPVNVEKKLDELCQFIFQKGDERQKTRALLCSVFHHSLHDRYYKAKDMFLISHIQDVIEKTDTKTQILYNRALVTLGLSAFRLGLINKAYDCLAGICGSRVRELLAQGQGRSFYDRDPEQEKIERRRQIPYHMHINPDLLECCHLTSSMLLELPNMAKGGSRNDKSRFQKYMQSYNRQDFTGPPENTREHVLSAAKAMMVGEWSRACDLILNLDVWKLIPADGGVKVKEMLREHIKEEAVRTYLITYGSHYESLSLQHLCQTFDMDEVILRRVISRMLFNKEISGAWETSTMLVLYSVDPSPLQVLSLQVADKVATLVESNERVLDPIANAYSYKEDWGNRGGDQRKWDDYKNQQGGDKRRLGSKSGAPKPQHARQFIGGRGARDGKGRRGPGQGQWGGDRGAPQQQQQVRRERRPPAQEQQRQQQVKGVESMPEEKKEKKVWGQSQIV